MTWYGREMECPGTGLCPIHTVRAARLVWKSVNKIYPRKSDWQWLLPFFFFLFLGEGVLFCTVVKNFCSEDHFYRKKFLNYFLKILGLLNPSVADGARHVLGLASAVAFFFFFLSFHELEASGLPQTPTGLFRTWQNRRIGGPTPAAPAPSLLGPRLL